jgi:nucleotide-binding universal stress UspA family protein
VLVAVDESEASERVARFVNGFFSPAEAELVGLNVARATTAWVPPAVGWGAMYPWAYPYTDHVWPTDAEEVRTEVQDEAEAAVVDSGLTDAVAVGELGDPVEAILRAAHERDVDLIVVGTNHRNLLQRASEPSVSKAVVRESGRPVLVVP